MQIEEIPPFASVLGRFRAAVGLTQEELAECAGVSVEAVSALERGTRTRPRPYTVRRLAAALELAPDDLAHFEAAARAGDRNGLAEAPPVGEFLGARPATPLVNRMDEVAALAAILDDAIAASSVRVLILAGEAGVGKTRLLQEAMGLAEARGCVVGWGRASRDGEPVPYAVLLQTLSTVVERVPTGSQTEVRRAWTRLRKGMESQGEGVPAQELRRSEIGDAVSSLLARVGRQVPVVLLFDDIHDADAESLAAIECLSRYAGTMPLAIITTFRDTNLKEDAPRTLRLLQALSRERLGDRLPVRRLSPDETSQLVSVLMGEHEVSDEFAGFVFRRTKGLPRLIHALVRSLGGRLELQGEIGAGAMGRVFRALDRETGRIVAAKLVLARDEIDLESLLRFQQEGALLARLDHPNIVRVYDTFVEEHVTCVVMELLEGESLGALLRRGAVPPGRAKEIGLQIATALEHAHESRIVHRDIKPDNVMVLPSGQIKVTDFGIARLLESGTPGLTVPGTIATTGMRMGTPLYMAPEQIAGRKIDNRTDLYALGALLYHTVTGRPPFEGGDALAVAVKHLQEEPVPPSGLNPAISADWDAAILKAMAKNPARRFQSASDMSRAIGLLNAHSPAAARARPRPPWGAAGIGVVAALLAVVALLWTHLVLPTQHVALSTRIDSYLSGEAAKKQLSGTVLVARNGSVLLDHGYGMADRTGRIPNGPNTRYGVGGVTTSLTMTEVERLIETGVLHWEDRICGWLPTCPRSWRRISLRMVLNGTAHLPNYQWGRAGGSTEQSLRACQSSGLDSLPASTIEYQNCTNLVLGTIIEKVTNSQWDNSVFSVPGMRNSGQLTDAMVPPQRAVDYAGTAADPDSTYNDYFAAYSTARDVYAYDRALFGGMLLSRRTMDRLFAPRAAVDPPDMGITNLRWGYHWKLGSLFGHRVVYTLGEAKNFETVNMEFPAAHVTVIVLSNDIQNDSLTTAIHTAALVFGKTWSAAPVNAHTLPPQLQGSYRRILRNADRLAAHDPDLQKFVGAIITMTVNHGQVHFVMPDGGTVDEYYRATDRGDLVLTGFTPTNQNSFCSLIPTQVPPDGRYRWSANKGDLVITRVSDNHCPDRASIVAGRWTKVR